MRVVVMAIALLVACDNSDVAGGGGGGGGSGGGGCTESADTCAGESICQGTSCVTAFGRVYEIRDVAITVPTTDPNGAAWDLGGGAPDLKISILVNNVVVQSSAEVSDQFSATFAGPFVVQPVAGGNLTINVVDVDATIDDAAFSCVASPITAAQLRSRSLGCSSARGTLRYEIDPR